ncbi:hypothetical protein ACU6C7_006084 [Pseudomonas aeruginosa]|nr:hypothetical protein [Pseudomonas aeruginosa]
MNAKPIAIRRPLSVLVVFLIATTGLTGCATSQQLDATNAQVNELHQSVANLAAQVAALEAKTSKPAPKVAQGCLLAGQLYSPGSVVAGRICDDTRGIKFANQAPEWGWVLHTNPRR